ncbi:rod shape-determining protein MreC [Kingella potus]|nr:rod shape-determining protein MreC [Kingella potus]UOP01787.1 rod shape-determining protein MreC [Kingella potus]
MQALTGGTAAQIVSNGKNPLSDKLLLDKGSKDGLRAGDPAVDGNGLIGQLTAVHPFVSELTVLTNAQSVVPVMVERTGVRSLLYGDGNRVILRYFPVDADLQPGDLLVTSGMDSVYPAGIPVARVEQAERSSGTPYYRTALSLPAAVHSSKHVLVLPQTDPPPVQTASEAAPAPPSEKRP